MNAFFAPLAERRTYRSLLYLALGLPLGVSYFSFLSAATSTGVSLVIVWVGIPLLAATVLAWRAMARFERWLTGRLLATPIQEPSSPIVDDMSLWDKARAMAGDPSTWRSFGWLLLRFPLGTAGFVLAVIAVVVPLSLIAAPVALLLPNDWVEPSWINSVDWLVWPTAALGVVLAGAAAHLVNGFAALNATWAQMVLGPSPRQERAILRRRAEAAEERVRLAHELHDSVGHTLTMNVVQAGAGGHVFDQDPDFARQALQNIETSGRRALADLDQILGLLREEDEGAERAAQPGLDGIAPLVADIVDIGVPVDLSMDGSTGDVPAAVGRSAYRIAQEALTNVVRHAGRVPTKVRVTRSTDALELEVVNAAPSVDAEVQLTSPDGGGRGLIGIRERVAILGGSVDAGPRAGGGFRVWARLPLRSTGT